MNQQIDNQDIYADSSASTESIPEEFLEPSLSEVAQSWRIDADNLDLSESVLANIANKTGNTRIATHASSPMPPEFATFLRDELTDTLTFTIDQERRLAQAVEMGESWVKLVLVQSSRGYVQTIVNKYLKHGVDPNTLMEVAMIAVSEAADRFILSRELPFSSYASFAVRHALSRVVESHKDQANPTATNNSGGAPVGREIPLSDLKSHDLEIRAPYINLKLHKPESEALKAVTPEFAWKYHVLPIRKVGNRLWVAMRNAKDVSAVDDVRMASKCLVQPMVTNAAELEEAILKAYGTLDSPPPSDSPTAIGLSEPDPSDDISQLLRETLSEMRGIRDELTSLRREISELRQERIGTVPRPSTARLFPFAPPDSASHRNR